MEPKISLPNPNQVRHSLRIIPFLLSLSLFLILIILANRNALPLEAKVVYQVHYGDKLGHLLVALFLTLSANLSFRSKYLVFQGKQFLLGSLIILMLMSLEECSQVFFAARTFSLFDLSSNLIGILMADRFFRLLEKRKRSHELSA